MPALEHDRLSRPPIQFVDRNRWRTHVEPKIAELVDRAGTMLRRHRAQVGPWIVELVSDDERTVQLFAGHRRPSLTRTTPDAFVYCLRGDSEISVCGAIGRSAIIGTNSYARVAQVCCLLVRSLTTTGTSAKHRESCMAWPGACVEYQPHDGPTRSVAILDPIDAASESNEAASALHAISLATCKSANALVANGLVCIRCDNGRVCNAEKQIWLSTRLLGQLPHLVPLLTMSPSEGVELHAELQHELRKYRDAADLERAIDAGLFSESQLRELTKRLAMAGAHSLVDPSALLGGDRFLDRATLTDCIAMTHDPLGDWLLQSLPVGDLVARLMPSREEQPSAAPFDPSVDSQREFIQRCLSQSNIATTAVNTLLPPAPTQFCLRHYLEGRCDSIRVLSASTRHSVEPLLAELRLKRQEDEFAPQSRRHGDCHTPRIDDFAFVHGTRPVTVVSFEKRGQRVEAVAFDTAADGFAQVRAVWPNQVADFFSRHAPLHARELFAELHNTLPE